MNWTRTLSILLLAAASLAASSQNLSAQNLAQANPLNEKNPTSPFKIIRPYLGEEFTQKNIGAIFSVANDLDAATLKVFLNGKNITTQVHQDHCLSNACEYKVLLTAANGLRDGENSLTATVHGHDRHVELRRVKFDKLSSSLQGTSKPNVLPPAVGLDLNSGGALPWVTITTGTPSSLQDDTDQTTYALPYPDTTFPTSSDPSCTSQVYQVLVLNRQTPLASHAYTCYNDSSSLKSYLTSLPQTDLVIVGTSWEHNAASGLDTSSIGGTNYSSYPTNTYPLGYTVIGVPGADAGSAYESYYIPADVAPLQRNPFAHGVVATDSWGNYNFYPADTIQYEVIPTNTVSSLQPSMQWTIQTGGNGPATIAYNPPSTGTGFWLLILDRVTLNPIDSNTGSCVYNSSGTCGTYYPTGSTDSTTAASAVSSLATALSGVTTRQLACLVSVGQPLQSASTVTDDLSTAIQSLGGSRYTLGKLTTANSTYTLVAPGAANAPAGTAALRSPYADGVVESSSLFTQQGQTGIIRGVLERDTKGLYRPTVSGQEDGKFNGDGATSVSLDFSFHQIAGFYPMDWPLTDTTNHIAAYHAVSAQYLSYYNETGSHSQDLRYFYYGAPGKYSSQSAALNDTSMADCLQKQQVPPGSTFTLQDWCDARAQLYQEVLALYNSDQYLGETSIQGLIDGSSGQGSIADNVINVATTLLNDQLMGPSSKVSESTVNAKVSQWMNLASAAIGLIGVGLGPADLPFVAGALNASSGGLKLGSAFVALDNTTAPLSYENGFDTTLGTLQTNATTYQENMITSYGVALDVMYSDWGKLSQTGAKTANSDSGWAFLNQVQPAMISQILERGASRALYLQAVPQYYQLDTYSAAPVSDIDKMGMLSYDAITMGWSCVASYPSNITSQNYSIFPHIGNTSQSDIFVIGGAINNQNRDDVKESLPSTDLLNTLFSAPDSSQSTTSGYLNLPTDPIYSVNKADGGYMQYRNGPSQGNGACYKPGKCNGVPDPKECVGP
jgi:hypothetical protein